ncbi:MAG: glycosyl hydrolase family 2 [Candidatus Symbiothrix sp.]|jgi:hypothetical protein|nr:glycosyl hydrolase family 2 [Candidatus Symbiothrix sp.]
MKIAIVFVFIALTANIRAQGLTDFPPITREAKPWTRWWWMGSAVDSTNLTCNLEALSRAGIGGVEITPIYGVKGKESQYIDYLSPRWMQMLTFTESEARRLNMSVDMNNGTGWPLGGPDVSIEDAACKAVFQCGDSIKLTVGKTGQQVKRAAPGGQGFVLDHFNRDAVLRYLAKFDAAFADNNTPFPNSFFNDSYEVYNADWTPSFLDEFQRRRGYDLSAYFAELIADGANDLSARVIADYRETVSDLLRDNFTQVWTDWAHQHGATTRNQAHGSPANLIDLYAAVDIPECESFGITDFDIAGLRKDSIRKINDSDPGVLKYASSAAHIGGKLYTSAETFTWLTEHFRTSLSQCKPEIDLMFVSGVNHVFFHGTTYSPQEAPFPGWKFYAAVDMSPTNSIWRDAPAFFSYVTRVQSFLQSGQPDNDFLLYLPIYDIWHEQRGNHYVAFAIHGMRERIPDFCKAVDQLMAYGYDVDYISDRFLSSCSVENGQIKTSGGSLYKALIFPSVKKMPTTTLQAVHRLARQGAKIIFANQAPDDVPGLFQLENRRKIFNETMQQLRREKTVSIGEFNAALLSDFTVYKENFITDFGGKMIRRKYSDGHIYFFAMLKNNPVDAWVKLGTQAVSAMIFDPMTGEKGKARLRNIGGQTEVYLQIRAGESLILKTFADQDIKANDWQYVRPTGRKTPLNQTWHLRFTESQPPVYEQFALPTLISWTDLHNDTLRVNMGTGLYSIEFHFDKVADKIYRLCLEDVRESARITLNGQAVGTLFAAPFEIDITRQLNDGVNRLEIEVTNLPANRIADYDRRGVEWRIFHEINFVNISYQNAKFDQWMPLPSGLRGEVNINEYEKCIKFFDLFE